MSTTNGNGNTSGGHSGRPWGDVTAPYIGDPIKPWSPYIYPEPWGPRPWGGTVTVSPAIPLSLPARSCSGKGDKAGHDFRERADGSAIFCKSCGKVRKLEDRA